MAKPTLSSLASGAMSRLGQLTVQAAKQARISAGKAAHKSLVEVNKLLDEAIEATKGDNVVASPAPVKAPVKTAAKKSVKAPAKVKAKSKAKTKTKAATKKPAAPK